MRLPGSIYAGYGVMDQALDEALEGAFDLERGSSHPPFLKQSIASRTAHSYFSNLTAKTHPDCMRSRQFLHRHACETREAQYLQSTMKGSREEDTGGFAVRLLGSMDV